MQLLLTNRKKIFTFFFIIGIVVYFSSFFNGFVADDNVYIVANPHMKQFDIISFFMGSSYYSGDIKNLGGIYYKPLFTTITSGLFILSGQTPFLYHLVQTTIHIINAFFVFLLFTRFFKPALSLFLSILFLLHPGNSESVVYIANLQDVLFFFFGISALLLTHKTRYSYLRYTIIFFLLLFSLLSKESGILFLPTLFLLVLLTEKKHWYSFFWLTTSVFITYCILRFAVANVSINHQAISPIMSSDFSTRLLTMPKIIFSYLLLFFFPKNLSWAQHWVVTTPTMNDFFIPLSFVILCITILCISFFTIKTHRKTLLFFSGVSSLGLFLHLHIIPLDFTFAERWFYFPSLGFIGITGVLITYLLTNNKTNKLLGIFAVVLLLIFATRTIIRTFNWKDDFTLVSHDILVDPTSFSLHNNLGYEYIKKKNFHSAITHLQKSIQLYPDHSAYLNLAHAYAQIGEKEKSIYTYKQALTLGDYFQTYQNYSAELLRQQNYKKARETLETALSKYPNNPSLWLLVATLEYKEGKKEQSFNALQNAHSLSPGIANYLFQKIQNNEDIKL